MNKIMCLILAAAAAVSAEEGPLKKNCPVTKFNELGYGTLSGRIQSLTMYRDYVDNGKNSGGNSSLGLELKYLSPDFSGLDFGLTYDGAAELMKENNSGLMANDDFNVLNEAWIRYRSASNLTVTAGRKVNNGEVFRADAFRQKPRSLEAVQADYTGVDNLRLTVGHAIRMSNWIQAGDKANFNDVGDMFSAGYDTDGITWGEALYTGVEKVEVALFDAYAYDVVNLIGTRVKWNVAEKSALLGYYRHEDDIGRAAAAGSDAFGVSLQQKVGDVTLEPGYFSVHGDKLKFEETTTGLNHSLGSLMMIYGSPFSGGAETVYMKAVTKVGDTVLYGLYSYTWHDKLAYDAQELNVVVKHSLCDRLSVALKLGGGFQDYDSGETKTATDSRLFVTWTF